ncbi:hypothetical protein ACTG15_15310 [Aeromonas sp. 164P]
MHAPRLGGPGAHKANPSSPASCNCWKRASSPIRLRIAALVASKDEYPLDVQGRIVRLQCWALPAEWDSEYRAAITFAISSWPSPGPARTGWLRPVCSPVAGTSQLLGEMTRPGRLSAGAWLARRRDRLQD